MTETARDLLVDGGTCPDEKVRVVPHGAPPVLARRASELAIKRALGEPTGRAGRTVGSAERFLLSTFGLISAGKGLETVIEALPAIVERHPEVSYLIAGRTHPDVAHREGERYRLMLEQAVLDLGLEDHVEFDDRFLSIEEIADLLAATDVFVTPVPGAGADLVGRADVRHRGRLRRRLDARTGTRRTCSARAPARSCRSPMPTRSPTPSAATSRSPMRWRPRAPKRGGSATSSPGRPSPRRPRRSSREAVELAPRRRRSVVVIDRQRVSMRTDHLLTLVDDVGIVQHANGVIPNRQSGYCVDDVARLAVVALELARRDDEQVWTSILYRSIAFLEDATDAEHGMRNFMGYDRRWLDEPHPGDHVGRSVWALGEILATAWVPAVVGPSERLLDTIVRTIPADASLRTGAYAALGLAHLDPDRLDLVARSVLQRVLEAAGRPPTRRTPARAGCGSRTGSPTTTPACHTP